MRLIHHRFTAQRRIFIKRQIRRIEHGSGVDRLPDNSSYHPRPVLVESTMKFGDLITLGALVDKAIMCPMQQETTAHYL
jgi:hypothetical protein